MCITEKKKHEERVRRTKEKGVALFNLWRTDRQTKDGERNVRTNTHKAEREKAYESIKISQKNTNTIKEKEGHGRSKRSSLERSLGNSLISEVNCISFCRLRWLIGY